MENDQTDSNYGKRPIWQWIVIYLVIALFVYGVIYYFIVAPKGGVSYNSGNTQQAPVASQQNSPTSPVPAAENSVLISNFKFSPATLTVKVGDTVTWMNQDSVDHSITADDGSFDTGLFAQGKTASNTFNQAGTFAYHCGVHPNMQGTIIVQ